MEKELADIGRPSDAAFRTQETEREARELMIHVIANFDMSGEMRKKIQVTERRRACAKELPEAEAVRTLWGRLRNDQVESMDRDLRFPLSSDQMAL
nr:hypothetical protein BaRGS_002578 [Batillaria attramentaria]